MIPLPGEFYEFHKERVISRPGQPLMTVPGAEIGPQISREDAVRRLRAGKDVYTSSKEYAYKLGAGPPFPRFPLVGPKPRLPHPSRVFAKGGIQCRGTVL